MLSNRVSALLSCALLSAVSLCAQTHTLRHSRYPNSPSNDPQLEIPTDQAQSCYFPGGSRSSFEQYSQFDDYQHPASKGYLCIGIPAGKTFVIDYLFAEADYDRALPAPAEWYLDTVAGSSEAIIGYAANQVGAVTANAHYVLSQSMHLPVNGGSRVTLILHNYYQDASNSIGETPGTAELTLVGHWEN
jgi:hypothetical protein